MKTKQLIILFLLFFTSCTQQSVEEVEYYPNGRVKRSIEPPDSIGRRTTIEYYSNGKIESKFQWRNGVKDGKTEFFNLNGILEEITFWHDGIAEGPYLRFYDNGKLYKRSTLKHGKEVGMITMYGRNGNKIGYTLNDREGREIYVVQYNTNGAQEPGMLIPIVEGRKDTIQQNEHIPLKIKFGYPLRGTVIMYVGEANQRGEILDTVAIKRPDSKGVFHYVVKSHLLGPSNLTFKFIHNTTAEDTLKLNNLFWRFNYFVLPPNKDS